MTSIFIVLLVLFAVLSMGSALLIPQANVAEGMKNKCGKPTEMDGDCRVVYQTDKDPAQLVKECRGVPGDMAYETDCPYSWYIDSDNGVCKKNDGNLQYIRKNGKCPPPNLGPGGTQNTLGPGGTQNTLGPGGTQNMLGPGGTQNILGPGGTQNILGPGGTE